jgi:nitrile hydratase beta subunit-like protein
MKWLSYLKIRRPALDTALFARFAPGDRVRIRQISPLKRGSPPYYVHGKSGVVEEVCKAITNPEVMTADHSIAPPRLVYRLRFSARDVWPESPGASGDTLAIDISEDWLEPSPVTPPRPIARLLGTSPNHINVGQI